MRALGSAILLIGIVVAMLGASAATARAALAPTAVDAKIEIVWPHDEQGRPAPVDTAKFVNVEVYLFQRGTLDPVPCGFSNSVVLRWTHAYPGPMGSPLAIEANPPAHDYIDYPSSMVGIRSSQHRDGKMFPVWVFNDVPIFTIDGQVWSQYFFVEVQGTDYRTNVWAHTRDARTYAPDPSVPATIADSGTKPNPVDARIQIVWPHDALGNSSGVTGTSLVNVAVDLAVHYDNRKLSATGWQSVGFGFDRPVWLLRALNDGFLEPVKVADQVTRTTASYGRFPTFTWPRWIFNNVDVSAAKDPANKYFFAISVEGVTTHTTVWAHGADGRTYYPRPDVPASSCS